MEITSEWATHRTDSPMLADNGVSTKPTEYTVDGLLSVLRLSHMYNIPDARRFAIKELDSLQAMRPALQLHASIVYEVPDWFKSAVKNVIATPLHCLLASDLDILDARILRDIVHTRRHIEDERMVILTAAFPFIQGENCVSDPVQCRTAWDDQWHNIKTSLFPSLSGGTSPQQVQRMLKKHEGFSLVCEDCFQRSARPFIRNTMWTKEDQIIRNAADQLYRKHVLHETRLFNDDHNEVEPTDDAA